MALMSSFKADLTAECFRHLGGITCAVCRTVMFFVFFSSIVSNVFKFQPLVTIASIFALKRKEKLMMLLLCDS